MRIAPEPVQQINPSDAEEAVSNAVANELASDDHESEQESVVTSGCDTSESVVSLEKLERSPSSFKRMATATRFQIQSDSLQREDEDPPAIQQSSSFIDRLFQRRSTMTDIIEQAAIHKLQIQMDSNDNLMAKLSPKMAELLSKVYLSKLFLIALVTVCVIGKLSKFWFPGTLFMVGMVSIVNVRLLGFMLTHSFELYFQELSIITLLVGEAILRWDEVREAGKFFHFCCLCLMHIVGILVVQCMDGYRVENWIKNAAIIGSILLYGYMFVEILYVIITYEGVDDVLLKIPWAWNYQTMSVLSIMQNACFNIMILFISKGYYQRNHKGCVTAATYPIIRWVVGGKDGVKRSIQSSLTEDRVRQATETLDIYKQSLHQRIEIFLCDEGSFVNKCCSRETALKIERFFFSIWNMLASTTLIISFGAAMVCSIWSWVIISELFLMVPLVIGLSLFDVKMVKYYFTSFDLHYKLFEWACYVMADTIWYNLQHEMDGLRWTEYWLRQSIITLIILYIVCIDAFHIGHKYKVTAMGFLILFISYSAVCILHRTSITDPSEVWEDDNVKIPVLQFCISLQSTMLNALCIFLIFVGKQLVLMLLHPGHAVMQVYPRTQWIDDQEHQCSAGPLIVVGPTTKS